MLLENFTYPQDTRVRNEAESLTSAGYEVVVLAPRGDGQAPREVVHGVEVERYRTIWASGSPWSYGLEYAVAHSQLLARSLRRHRRRGRWTVHLHGPPDTLSLAGLLARRRGHRVVYDMHDSGPELFAAKFGSGPSLKLGSGPSLKLGSNSVLGVLRAAQAAAIRCAHGVIVTNRTQLDLVRHRVTSAHVPLAVVRNGPRLAEFPDPPTQRGGSLDAPRIVYVGTLDVQDGVLDLPEVLRHPGLEHAQLTVVGDGDALEELQRRCAAAGVENRVTCTGRVPHDQVARLIAAADLAVDPAPGNALNHGSTMIKIAEYMASGRAIVAYDLRETRYTAAATAVYAPCDDPRAFARLIVELARDGDRRVALGREARRRSLALVWERSQESLLELYERVAATT